ncbi:MAG: hypothetical protein M9894_04990 [Planctomycetes bacterium]|nr:hypothetical protein [Planctomycetota bacterium]
MSTRARRRGTTLVELMVYLGLISSGMVVLVGLEAMAQRSLALQQALIDLDLEASGLLGALRRDVEAARRLEVERGALVLVRHDGVAVRYEAGLRVEAPGAGERRVAYPRNAELRVALDAALEGPPVVTVEAVFVDQGRAGPVRRAHRRVAAPRGELTP